MAFLPDGKLVVSGSRDDTMRLWDVETGAEQKTVEGYSGGDAFLVDCILRPYEVPCADKNQFAPTLAGLCA